MATKSINKYLEEQIALGHTSFTLSAEKSGGAITIHISERGSSESIHFELSQKVPNFLKKAKTE